MLLTGKCKWARVHQPYTNTYKGTTSKRYSICVEVDEEFIAACKEHGIQQKIRQDKEDGHLYFEFRKAAETSDGKLLPGPAVVDSKLNPIPDTVQIGNGSTVNVQYSFYEFNSAMGQGHMVVLQAVQVVDLVEYVSNVAMEFNESDGFNVSEDVTLGELGVVSDDSDVSDESLQRASKEI